MKGTLFLQTNVKSSSAKTHPANRRIIGISCGHIAAAPFHQAIRPGQDLTKTGHQIPDGQCHNTGIVGGSHRGGIYLAISNACKALIGGNGL
ncbi:hypothetical protein M5D96_013861 [Drosophila gunungcola]|uniref:Uncharacterized protein n=1 Tax=Drosophila gunungcola TaxID=103775 RepID=A0A9Q0BIY8_9MUSC|nr:hypothetical protein M5D96_013861 [Drosophila gunungcola]